MNSKFIEISEKLKTQLIDKIQKTNEISIFLCGGSRPDESKYRREIGKTISKTISKYKYSVYYPEDMFIELILGYQKHDLLTLENLLADSVNAIVILLQSPGTFTELGAFTNYDKLSNKLIVVIDPTYERSKSFINLGPVRFLKTKTKSKIIFAPMDDSNLNYLANHIADNAREVSKHSLLVNDLSNPISAYRFYLSLIYVFEPISKDMVFNIVKALTVNNDKLYVTVAETVINSLINERKVSFSTENLSTTPKGIDELLYEDKTKKKSRNISEFLTGLRIEALNLTLRRINNKKLG